CDETKPGCRNCAQKGFECPGYQQRLQWSTKHERATTTTATKTSGPANFTQLVTAASESIASTPPTTTTAENSGLDGNRPALVVPQPCDKLTLPAPSFLTPSASASPTATTSPSSLSPSSSTASPPAQYEDPATGTESYVTSAPPPLPPTGTGAVIRGTPNPLGQALDVAMCQQVVDIPSFLINHWFGSVCSSWSALDSPTNPYRRLTADLWSGSEPVFYTLQAISAASLVERLPGVMRDTARSASRKAFDSIRKELIIRPSGSQREFPTALLLSLFCMSSSMCWMEASQLGQKFVRQAREVLRSLDTQSLSNESRELLNFFNGCLVYEEMLRSVVSEEEVDFQHMLSWPEPTTPGPLTPAVPHPWSGVSSDILRLFGKAVALCRRSRIRWRINGGTSYRILQGAMKDIEEATAMEKRLLLIHVPQLPIGVQPLQTTDRSRDLYHLTEAYRLCAILQLYETFPDLSSQRIPNAKETDEFIAWKTLISPLALHVTDVLSKVPPGNLSCIQPLLCLCAGSGLRYDHKVPLRTGPQSYLLSTGPTGQPLPTPDAIEPGLPSPSLSVPENAIKTSQARQTIMERLEHLETCLPPKPIGVAKQLMRAVWNAYDQETELPRRTHWLDVMSSTGLHSLFG
ncbi:fungal-specific transcription factor domain-containing protein, partial [Dichotomopilus funicola]